LEKENYLSKIGSFDYVFTFSPLDFLDSLINSLMWLLPPSLLMVPCKIVDGTKDSTNMEFGGYKT
jgi:hypothetical protein